MPAAPAKAQAFTPAHIALYMSKLLFRLRHVTEDEAEDVRALLEQNSIEFFETFAGNWGISLPALWLRDEAQFAQARQLIEVYQEQRRVRMQNEYAQQRTRGEVKTMWHSFIENPLRFLLYMSLAALVLFFSVQIFLNF